MTVSKISDVLGTESKQLESLSKQVLEERRLIMNEIQSTEVEYNSNLQGLVKTFIEPFNPSQHGGRKVARIFTNIKELFEIHVNILRSLPDMTEPQALLKTSTIYTMALPQLRGLYLTYYKSYLNHMALLQNTRSYSHQFADFINEKRDACGGRDLGWLLRQPLYRIIHYNYLFNKLQKCTLAETSLEYVAVANLLNLMRETTFIIEQGLADAAERRQQAFKENTTASLHLNLTNSQQQYEGWNVLFLGDDEERSKTRLQQSLELSSEELQTTVPKFRNYLISCILDPPYVPQSQEVLMKLWDTTGFENYKRMLALLYPLTDVYVLCFSIGSQKQFRDLIPKWYRETKQYLPKVPFLLVGTHSELRKCVSEDKLVSFEEASNLAGLLSVPYFECSFKTGEGIPSLTAEIASCLVNRERYNNYQSSESKGDFDDAKEKILASILDQEIDLSCLGLGVGKSLHLPPELKHCTNLTSLDLSWNLFETLPTELFDLPLLHILKMNNNKLQTVNGIEELKQLKELYLEGNMLNFLPAGLGHCTNLMVLHMESNPLDTLPKDIFAKKYFDEYKTLKDRNQLFAYLRSIQEGGQAPHHRAKVMFVGDGEVGKTSLLNCFLDMQHSNAKRKRATSTVSTPGKACEISPPKITDGIDISEVHWVDKENDQELVWDCWDYAGQEIYYTTHQFFLSAGAVYLVIFNLLNRDFSRIEYWLNSVHTRARGSPIVLVGTHADDPLCTEEYIRDYQKELKVRYLKRFKSSLGVPSIKYVITLSNRPTKKGVPSDDVKKLMDQIGHIMISRRLVGKTYPKSWLGLEKHLRTLSKQRAQNPFMTWKEFTETASNCHISEEDVGEAAAFLHSSGVLCHFNDEHSGLANLVILDPQFLTNVMSAVISLRSGFATNGEILEKNLVHVWRAFDPSLHKTLMGLLERFEIAFALPSLEEGPRYLIPALLPDTQPDSYTTLWAPIASQENVYQLGRIYLFKFLPLGFFSRLFVRILHLPGVEAKEYWNTGIIITMDDEKAIIRYNPTEYKLTMNVRGTQDSNTRGQLLRLLIESVETVIEGWYETDVDISVPCSHCVEAGSYSPFMFSFEECAQQVTSGNGKPFVMCRGVRKVRIDAIAPDISFADMLTKRIDFKDVQLTQVIGTGAFGQVYEGNYSGNSVAVKILEKQKKQQFSEYEEPDDQEFKRFNEFQREVWIMSCIKHEKLVRLVGISTNPPSMIMELLPMGDLYHILYPKRPVPPSISDTSSTSVEDDPELNYRWTRLQSWHSQIKSSWELRLRIALDIAKGMRHLHSLSPPIIHRDLRSPNIFLTSLNPKDKTVAKVGDFGLSRLVATTLAGGDFNVNWLAPEVMKGEQYTEKMDVYSYGIILNELISLQKPFEEYDETYTGKPREVFKKAVIGGLRPTIPPKLPEGLKELVEACWGLSPGDRPPFTEVVDRLAEIMKKEGYDVDPNDDVEIVDELSESPSVLLLQDSQSNLALQKTGILKFETRLEPKHPHSVQCLIKVENEVWAGCRNGVIRIWDAESGIFVEDFKAHKAGVYSLQNVAGFIWSGAEDGTIYAFEIGAKGKEKKPLKVYRPSKGKHAEAAGVRCLLALREFSDMDPRAKSVRVLSGDTNGTVTIWKVKKRNPAKRISRNVLVSLEGVVNCLYQDQDTIWVGHQANISVVDLKICKVIATWVAHAGPVNALTNFGRFIWSAGHDGQICVWDSGKYKEYQNKSPPHKKIAAHTSRVFCIERLGKYMVSGSFDMSVIVYDGTTFKVLQEEKHHKDGVRSLVRINDSILWSGSMQQDASVGVWEDISANAQ